MKASRFLTVLITFVLAFSVWGAPASVYAKSAENPGKADVSFTVDAAKVKTAKLRIGNYTGGTLYVTLVGPAGYSLFVAETESLIIKNITPGKYRIVVKSLMCSGSLGFNIHIRGSMGLGPFVCSRPAMQLKKMGPLRR